MVQIMHPRNYSLDEVQMQKDLQLLMNIFQQKNLLASIYIGIIVIVEIPIVRILAILA